MPTQTGFVGGYTREEYERIEYERSRMRYYEPPRDYYYQVGIAQSPLEVPINNKKNMKKISNMMKKLLDSDIQDLVKVGFINGDLEITVEGKQALFEILFDTNKPALVELAKAKIAEEKDSK